MVVIGQRSKLQSLQIWHQRSLYVNNDLIRTWWSNDHYDLASDSFLQTQHLYPIKALRAFPQIWHKFDSMMSWLWTHQSLRAGNNSLEFLVEHKVTYLSRGGDEGRTEGNRAGAGFLSHSVCGNPIVSFWNFEPCTSRSCATTFWFQFWLNLHHDVHDTVTSSCWTVDLLLWASGCCWLNYPDLCDVNVRCIP